jgi:HK97 family phage major capsid protein
VDDKSKDETPKPESDIKDLIQSLNELAQAKIADATKAKDVPGPTDVSTRPDFSQPTGEVKAESAQDERFTRKEKSLFPHRIETLDDDVRKSINFNSSPRGDFDNFSMARYAYAKQREHYLGTPSLKSAPWETMFYDWAKKIQVFDPVTKAQGDMVSGQDGGFLAPEFWSTNFFDQLYAAQVVTQLPITTLPMGTRVVHMPKLTTAISISYAAENATLANTTAQFGQLSFTARKQGQIIQISNELIRDAVPAADAILQNHAVKWMALDRDKQLILGNGQAGAPVGLLNTGGSGIGTVDTFDTGQSPLYGELLEAIVGVEILSGSTNVPIGQANCTGVLGMPSFKQELMGIKDSDGRPLINMIGLSQLTVAGQSPLDGFLGVPKWRFSQVFNESAGSRHVTFGDWQYLVYMVRQDVEIMVSNVAGTSFASDQTWIRLISRYDVGVAHPEAFYTFTNA